MRGMEPKENSGIVDWPAGASNRSGKAELQSEREVVEGFGRVIEDGIAPTGTVTPSTLLGRPGCAISIPSIRTKLPGPADRQRWNVLSVPSNKYSKPASTFATLGGEINRSAVRRLSATPDSIGLGEPMVGRTAGPTT